MEEFGIIPKKAGWVSWDDDFVDELRRTVKACKLFLFFPIFLMADGGVDSVLGSMGGSMTSKGVPNDLLSSCPSYSLFLLSYYSGKVLTFFQFGPTDNFNCG